jgi:hypothetical protein
MDKIISRIEELCRIARQRMKIAGYAPGSSYAEILWLSHEEALKFNELRLLLPSYGQEAFEAKQRIILKIVKRRILKTSKRNYHEKHRI